MRIVAMSSFGVGDDQQVGGRCPSVPAALAGAAPIVNDSAAPTATAANSFLNANLIVFLIL